jgi:hypothetical protein
MEKQAIVKMLILKEQYFIRNNKNRIISVNYAIIA